MVGIRSQIFYVFDVQNLPCISVREIEQWNLTAGTVKPSENKSLFVLEIWLWPQSCPPLSRSAAFEITGRSEWVKTKQNLQDLTFKIELGLYRALSGRFWDYSPVWKLVLKAIRQDLARNSSVLTWYGMAVVRNTGPRRVDQEQPGVSASVGYLSWPNASRRTLMLREKANSGLVKRGSCTQYVACGCFTWVLSSLCLNFPHKVFPTSCTVLPSTAFFPLFLTVCIFLLFLCSSISLSLLVPFTWILSLLSSLHCMPNSPSLP